MEEKKTPARRARQPAAKRPASTKPVAAAPKKRVPKTAVAKVTAGNPDRQARIALVAYLRAERRGFAPGFEVEDWLAAEAEIAEPAGSDTVKKARVRTPRKSG